MPPRQTMNEPQICPTCSKDKSSLYVKHRIRCGNLPLLNSKSSFTLGRNLEEDPCVLKKIKRKNKISVLYFGIKINNEGVFEMQIKL